MSSIEQKKKNARIKLFRRDYGLNFFGVLAYQFQWNVHKMSPAAEGYIQFDPDNLNRSNDGIFHINEDMISKPDYTHDNLIALIIHEQIHILQKHGLRRGQRNPQTWNFAIDHVTDRDLKDLSDKIKPYENRYNILEELHKEQPNCTAEQAYDWIRKKQQQNQITITMIGSNGQPMDGQNGVNPGEAMIKVEDHSTGQTYYVSPYAGGQDQTEPISPDKAKQYEALINQTLAQARALFETMKDRGLVGGNLASYLDKVLRVEIPWESLLEKAIKTNVILKPDERSWRSLNKYFQPHGLTLPGYNLIEDNEGVGLLIILIDTSGSISDKNLKQFSSVIVQSMKFFREILLLTHDVPIHQEKTFDSDNIHGFYEFIKKEGFQGRGGTSHRAVFDKIEDMWTNDNDVKDELSMVISLTDNYSDIENIYKNYRWIKNETPLVFILTEDGKESEYEYDSITTIKINN